jgi:hypothetical protein
MVCRTLSLVLILTASSPLAAQSLEFNRDVRPILSNNCFLCHGPDKAARKGDLRLDVENDVYEDRGDGVRIIVPGNPAESALYQRMITHEPAKRMPPAKSNKTVTAKEIETVKKWIEQGGKYQKHWSFIPPQHLKLPPVKNPRWIKNPIDSFILSRLESEGMAPSPEADRRTLLRRLSFDLTGLPPTNEQVEAFVRDPSPDAYEKQVDRLLTSKRYGERMAVYWLDLVRFADTGGYHSDNHRDITPYRDWVIEAFNSNMPYDQFTTEQLAGDLLPEATNSQKIASGYNRLLQTTEEGGAQAKEYQAKYFADRVRNVSTVWLGLTMGCTECHNHPYDPITTKEFYQFGSFFADISEAAVGRQAQTPLPTPEQAMKLKAMDAEIAELAKSLAAKDAAGVAAFEKDALAKNFDGVTKELETILRIDPGKRNQKQKETLVNHVRDADAKAMQAKLVQSQKSREMIQKSLPTTLVTMATSPRTIRILPRGNWLDDSGEIVFPNTPASLPPLKRSAPDTPLSLGGRGAGGEGDVKTRYTRLDLAKWIASPDNPMTSRTFMNRLWMLTFGQGLVKTLDDLGSQGAWPSHPELLDWLALEFEKNWDVKAMLRLLVTSNAYRQSSVAHTDLRQRDPYNVLVARQGRYRLDAEFVRDNALAISGLLVEKVGGVSVKPYQPAGYWKFLNFPTRDWAHDKNENQYRRGLYTYWQRSFLHPSLLAFDASTREECTVERPRSNTPQQALTLLNDPTYVEASRVFAESLMKLDSDREKIQAAFRRAVQRDATADEIAVLTKLYQKQLQHYQANAKDAEALLRIGERPLPPGVNAAELAAWTNVARAVLNMHETMTRN